MHDLDHDLSKALRLNVNVLIESKCGTFYFMVIVLFSLSSTIYEIFAVEICTTSTLALRMG